MPQPTANNYYSSSYEYSGNKGVKVRCVDITSNNKYIATAINGRRGVRNIQIHENNYDKNSSFPLIQELKNHNDWIICIKFTKDNNYLLSSSYDCTVRIWNYLIKGESHHSSNDSNDDDDNNIPFCTTMIIGESCFVNCIDVSSNHQYFATISLNDKKCKVFPLPSSSSLDDNSSSNYNSNDYDNESKKERTAIAIDSGINENEEMATSSSSYRKYKLDYTNPIKSISHVGSCIAFTNDSKYIVLGSLNGTIKLYELESGITHTVGTHNGPLQCIATTTTTCTSTLSSSLLNSKCFSNYDDCSIKNIRVASGGFHNTALVWNTSLSSSSFSSSSVVKLEDNETVCINDIVISSDGSIVITISNNGMVIRIWDVITCTIIQTIKHVHTECINSLVLSYDNKYLLSVSDDSTFKVFNIISIIRHVSWNNNNVRNVVMLHWLCNNNRASFFIDKKENVNITTTTNNNNVSSLDLAIKEAPDSIFYYIISFIIHPIITRRKK